MNINDGIILVYGEISYGWMLGNFWRAFVALTLHYVQILALMQMSRVLGWFVNNEIERKMEDIDDRPNDDNIDIFSKVKMPIYYKSLANN